MNWKNTWILVGLALALLAFIFLYERRLNPTGTVAPLPELFTSFKPLAATSLQVRRGTQFTLGLERTNGLWHFTKPFTYPAAAFPVQQFLEALERLVPTTHISARDIQARKQSPADFGFDAPPIVVTLEKGGERRELRFGSRTPTGDQIYVEVVGRPGYYVVGAELLDRVPRTQDDWRDTALFHLGEDRIDRGEITRSGAGFALQLDPTNKLWRLARPGHRADQLQVRQLLDKLQAVRVVEFVTDDPRADADAFGLVTPEFEMTLASGPTVQKVQFGRAATNDPTRVYARLAAHTNVVLVPKAVVDLLATPYSELRERQLVAFTPELIDVIEVRGEESFLVRKGADGQWLAGEAPADPVLIAQWLGLMSQLQVTEFVKDVVTDFTRYGLAPPQRQYVLRTAVTNASGVTNVLVAQIDLGTNGTGERVFARRWDEDSVYSLRLLDFARLPTAPWQLRDHRVWNFTTNQIARLIVRQDGSTREVLRQPNGEWAAGLGWTGEVNPFALEEIAFRLGELNSVAWVARGETVRAQFGFTTNSPSITVEVRGEKPQMLTLEFGGLSPLRLPYALTPFGGQPSVFEFPWTLYMDLQRYFHLAPPANPGGL